MNKTLQERQAPIKKRFEENPDTAEFVLDAGLVLVEGNKWKASVDGIEFTAGLPVAAGGETGYVCPGNIFLTSLGACAAITLSAAAEYMGIQIKKGEVNVSGRFDMRGTMAVSEDVLVGFSEVDINFQLESDAEEVQLKQLLEAVKVYSVNCRTVSDGAVLKYHLNKKTI